MAHRFIQEEKFKNISLKLDQIPMHTSNIVRTANTEMKDSYRPSTPINTGKYIMQQGQNFNIEIRTSHLGNNERIASNTSSPKARSQIRQRHQVEYEEERQRDGENQNEQAYDLKRQLEEKEQIISELKNIIKLSNENNSRIRPKSIYMSQKSPDRERGYEDEQKELKELRHNVKVLTIENNALSGYIDKLKNEMNSMNLENSHLQRKGGVYERQHKDHALIQDFKQENKRLKELIQQKEGIHQDKIGEYISTYKSLANQCKRLQNQKQGVEAENQRLSILLRDSEQTQRKATNRDEERLGKTMTEKLSIVKIKQQYAESIKQIRETIHIEFENIFDNYRITLIGVEKKVAFLQRRVKKLEQELKYPFQLLKQSREAVKKSEIYIEEGSESCASQSSIRKNNTIKSVTVSRLYEQTHGKTPQPDEEAVRPLHQEISRLKEIITDLENQMSERSDNYTFRERYENSEAEISAYRASQSQKEEDRKGKQKEMIQEINRLKEEIDKLQVLYHSEKQELKGELDEREERISEMADQLHDLKSKYNQSLDEMKNLVSIERIHQDLHEQLNSLRLDNDQCLNKIVKYKKLCNLLQEQSEENMINYQLFDEVKKQLFEIKERYHYDQVKFNATEIQNREILIANQELKQKLEQTLVNYQKQLYDYNMLKEQRKKDEAERQQFAHRLNYNEKVINILQNEIKAKKEIEIALIEQKNSLEKQLINYLSIFNKLTFEELKSSNRKGGDIQELGIQDLLNKLSRLEASFNDLHSSKRQKREIIAKIMNESMEEIQLSSIKRKGHE